MISSKCGTPCLVRGRDLDEGGFTAPIIRHQPLFLELLAHLHRIGVGMIALVHRHDDRALGSLGVAERLERLRHHAVVGRDHEHNNVGDIRAPGAHGAERGVTRRVEEGDLRQLVLAVRMRHGNRVSSDVLGDATGFTGRDIGFANHVEQRGLAVVDVAHDGDDRGARLELLDLVLLVEFHLFDGGVDSATALALLHFKPEAVFRAQPLGDDLVDGLVDVGHDLQLHQVGDELERFSSQLLRQFADDDGRFECDQFPGGGRNKPGFGATGRPLRRDGDWRGRSGATVPAGGPIASVACARGPDRPAARDSDGRAHCPGRAEWHPSVRAAPAIE
jgi:hypothetical protein